MVCLEYVTSNGREVCEYTSLLGDPLFAYIKRLQNDGCTFINIAYMEGNQCH